MRASLPRLRPQWLLYVVHALVIAAALLVPRSLLADSTSQTMEAIQRRMEQGLALFVAEKPGEAAKVFEEGYAEHPYSAFLFNAGVCYEKIGKNEAALAKYQEYMRIDPNSPDIAEIQKRMARLEATIHGGPPIPVGDVGKDVMRSLVVVESEPSGAPVRVFRPNDATSPAFRLGQGNPEWKEIVSTTAPTSLSLSVGRYHIVVDKFHDFNPSGTELNVTPGHVHHFRANLSQGVFMAFLRVSGNVKGAHVYLDDGKKTKPEWGTTPYGELVPAGEHDVLVERPGYQPIQTKVTLESGERKELEVSMARVDYGFIRVQADVDVTISLDGKVAGRWQKGQPPIDIQAPAGSHTLTAVAEDRKDFESQVAVPKGQVLPVKITMIPKYPRGTAWTQAILAGACLGTGIYLGLESERLEDELQIERQRGVLEAGDGRISKGYWFAIGADVGFGASAVLGALSTWNFIKDPLPESSHEEATAVEFDDPLSRPGAAPAVPATVPVPPAASRPRQESPGVRWQVVPHASKDVAGIAIGGTF